jgi:hypothetical protein
MARHLTVNDEQELKELIGLNGTVGSYPPQEQTSFAGIGNTQHTDLVLARYTGSKQFFSRDKDTQIYRVQSNTSLGTSGGWDLPSAMFSGDTLLENVIIGKRIVRLGNAAFSGCTNLKGATLLKPPLYLPDNLHTIGSQVFYNCTSLTGYLYIPDSVLSIGTQTFFGTNLNAIRLSNNLEVISDGLFQNCSSLVEVTGNNTESPINTITGIWDLPDSIHTIGNNAFDGCSSAAGSIKIPENIQSIGSNAFDGMDNYSMYINAPSTVFTGIFAFGGVNVTLYVTPDYFSSYDFTWESFQLFIGTIQLWSNYPNIP